MKSIGWKNTAELVGLASIVASLLLVVFELRQNTAISTAQAVFDLNTVLDESYRRRAENPQLDALVENGHNNPSSLSKREQSQFDSWLHDICLRSNHDARWKGVLETQSSKIRTRISRTG
jgi:hypothetical protein